MDEMTFEAFCEKFNSEHACAEALTRARWPEGFRCPDCRHSHYYLIRTRRLPLYECRSCRLQTSVIAGTIMEGSSTPLTRWFQAMFLMAQPSGISAVRLSRVIQVTYKTAWLMARKIRHAMQHADRRELLIGTVRVDATYYGYHQYDDARQPLFIGGALDHQNEPTYVKIKQPDPRHVNNATRQIDNSGAEAFISDHTDGQDVTLFNRQLTINPYSHQGVKNVIDSKRKKTVHPALNCIRWDAADWLNVTFHGIGSKHLQAYLDEFCFRLNLKLRNIPVLGQLFHWAASTPTQTYKELTRYKPVLVVPWAAMESKAKWKGKYLSARSSA